MKVYIDLNVFDRLEKLEVHEKSFYQMLLSLIKSKLIQTAYSNAHLNDLFRGYQKKTNCIEGHWANIQSFTDNL